MKKIILIIAAVALFSGSAFAFGAREHSAIAYIAEKYLSPKARAAVNEIADGEKLMLFASHPDKFREFYLYNGHKVPHTCPIDADLNPSTELPLSPIPIIEMASRNLKNYKTTQNPDSLKIYLAYVVHLVGDIHCPSHVKYSPDTTPKSPKGYILKDEKIKFHKAWDSGFSFYAFTGGPMDLAFLADRSSKKQIKEYQKGTLLDWEKENAQVCFPFTRDGEVDDKGYIHIDNIYVQQHAQYAKDQIMKAGYRLAETLNCIFK